MILISALGLAGYLLFRLSNDQKHEFRRTNGKMEIGGRPALFLEATYKTTDGIEHSSKLLCSGYWGVARHLNYLGDLMLSSALSFQWS